MILNILGSPNSMDDFPTLPEIKMAPENWWLEDDFRLNQPIFLGATAMLVSGRVCP